MTGPKITLARKSGAAATLKRVFGAQKLAAYVGVPAATSAARSEQLLDMAGKAKGRRKERLQKAADNDINNAELLFIHTNGSPLKKIPARPVLKPALAANQQNISKEIAASVTAAVAGDHDMAVKNMKRAALRGQNAARSWFTDGRNSWAPNAPATIRRKGSNRPLIDTGALRASIQGIVDEE